MNKQEKHHLRKRKIRPSSAAVAARSTDEVSNKPGQRGSNVPRQRHGTSFQNRLLHIMVCLFKG